MLRGTQHIRAVMRELWRRIGRRGTTLLFLFLLDMTYSASLAYPPAETARSATTRYIADVAPLPAWAILWAMIGILCAVGAFRRHDKWAFAAATGLKVLWGVTFLLGWAFVGLDRGWLSGVIWMAFAAFVFVISTWPEPSDMAVMGRGGYDTP